MYSLTYYLYYYYHTSNQATYLSSKYLLVSSIILRIEDPWNGKRFKFSERRDETAKGHRSRGKNSIRRGVISSVRNEMSPAFGLVWGGGIQREIGSLVARDGRILSPRIYV